jgi:putative thioredoxin
MPALDVTDATFEAEVLERSDRVPVVVDLWAPWCGPCRTLGPIIERVVDGTGGAVELAKVNIDENPQVASSFRVQSIPAVFVIHERRIVDQFVGALPERSVQEFVDRFVQVPSEADDLASAGDEPSLRKALELEPGHEGAIVGLAGLLAERGDAEEAISLLERIPETAETRRIAARARLTAASAVEAASLTSVPGSRQGGDADSDSPDLDARLASLLERVPGDEEARQEIVDLLETMDDDDPRRAQYRRALAARLF